MTTAQQDKRLEEAKDVLAAVGMPPRQRNDRTALVLLSMLNLTPTQEWREIEGNSLGITECMNWMVAHYPDIPKGRKDPTQYAPNTRETVRKNSVQPLVSAGILVHNADAPGRSTNDQNNRYHPSDLALRIMVTYGTSAWERSLREFHEEWKKLSEVWAAEREAHRVPVELPDGTLTTLSSGEHSELIKAIIESFASQFTPGGTVVYLGDTGSKWVVNMRDYLADLGVVVNPHGKMPDVVIHYTEKNWLVLVEAVTSTGPVDGKRVGELKELFEGVRAGLVFVTAFPTRRKFRRFAADIAWETEVWVAENPTHMVHFDGERFLGPYDESG